MPRRSACYCVAIVVGIIALSASCWVGYRTRQIRMAITHLEAQGGGSVDIYRPWNPYSSDPFGTKEDILFFVILRRPFDYVGLIGEAVTNEDMHNLVTLGRIDHLDLQDSNIDGRGLQVLTGMSYVRELNLLDVSIVDADLAYLKGICGLQKVSLPDLEITDKAAWAASKQIPNVWLTKGYLNIKDGKPVVY
jgi:hypothetical protein